MIGPSAPVSNADQFAQTLAAYEARIADLERAFGRYRGGAGAPGGTGVNGQEYWDSTNKRLYRSDGAGWIIMAEPTITTFAPTITSGTGTITTVGAVAFSYRRHDGWLDWFESITITTNGTGASWVRTTLPVAMNVGQNIGGGREIGVSGSALTVTGTASQGDILTYNNLYPGATGAVIQVRGQYQMTTRYS